MLVLTRRSQQSIMIGKDVVITVLEVRGDQVRLGVSAPRDVEDVMAADTWARQRATATLGRLARR